MFEGAFDDLIALGGGVLFGGFVFNDGGRWPTQSGFELEWGCSHCWAGNLLIYNVWRIAVHWFWRI